MRLLWNALNVVQPVNAHDHFHAIEALFELLDLFTAFSFLRLSKNEDESLPKWYFLSQPSNSASFGVFGRPRMRVQDERK